jgi:predicted GH43/DUF377 family glycosyl hydrolase
VTAFYWLLSMLARAVVIAFLSLIVSSICGRPPFRVVRLSNDSNAIFLVVNNQVKPVPDIESVATLGVDINSIESVPHDFIQGLYSLDVSIPSLKYADKSMDDIMRVEILKSHALNGKLMRETTYAGDYLNPCIMKWQDRLLLATGLSWGVVGKHRKAATNTINIRWLNHSAFPFATEEPYLGIHNEVEEFPSMVLGQDPRIVVLENPDHFEIYYTNQFEKIARMGMAEIMVNRTTQNITVIRNYHTIHPTYDWRSPQKNWSPFVFGQEVLLIQSVNPFQVVKTMASKDDPEHRMLAYKESASEAVEVHWPYGELRGGTNAVYLPQKNVYLAILHSAGHAPGNYLKTYVMGAYTFSASPPFKLLSISPYPIMPEQFYTGAWYPIKNRQIDYCLFPLSLFLEGEAMYVGAGYQDNSGYLLRFDLQEVLNSLVPV